MVARDTNLLRGLFAAKGLIRQKQIAAALYVSENTVTRWFQGEAIHRGHARRVAEFLGKDTGDLFVPKAAPPPPTSAEHPPPMLSSDLIAAARHRQRDALTPAEATEAERVRFDALKAERLAAAQAEIVRRRTAVAEE